MSFEQEERYIVVKLKRLGSEEEAALREFLQSYQIDTEQCVVVEHDWGPIYDETWDAVKRLAEGRQSIASERDEAQAEANNRHDAKVVADALEVLLPIAKHGNSPYMIETLEGNIDHLRKKVADAAAAKVEESAAPETGSVPNLTRLKARWQAEALESASMQYDPDSLHRNWLREEAAEIRRQAEDD
jgi:hypothetical protein